MAILGEPDAELEDLLAEIEAIQRAGMKPVKAGAMGGEIYAAAEKLMSKSKHHNHMHFLAHGMGLVSHEVPHLTAAGPVPYGDDATRPLESGMVISVETTLQHPRRGFIKLEDTVAVTENLGSRFSARAPAAGTAAARRPAVDSTLSGVALGQALDQKIQSCCRERAHVREPVGVSRFDGDGALGRPGDC